MNKKNIKREIRGWLPPQPNNPLTKLKHYSVPIAIGLTVAILSLSLFAFSSNLLFSGSAVRSPPIPVSSSNDTVTENVTMPTASPTPLNITRLTEDEAINIALPIIQKYATENSRTIINVTASWGMMADMGKRGGPTLQQAIQGDHNTFWYYPAWLVTANFQFTMPQLVDVTCDSNGTISGGHYPSDATWIYGYEVDVWADTGQIAGSHPEGVW